MKIITTSIVVIGLITLSAFGFVAEEPVEYKAQLRSADMVAIVEVESVQETGKKKIFEKGGFSFREQILRLKVLSAFKGEAEFVACSIYREPTREELIADGVPEDQVMKALLNLGVNEGLHLFPARVTKGDHLLTYLKLVDHKYQPVTGYYHSSRSFLRVEPSNIVNRLHLK